MTTARAERDHHTSEKGRARYARYRASSRGMETIARNNQRRLFVCGMYLGMCGLTEAETKELLRRAESQGAVS